jgi:hypothetical protein
MANKTKTSAAKTLVGLHDEFAEKVNFELHRLLRKLGYGNEAEKVRVLNELWVLGKEAMMKFKYGRGPVVEMRFPIRFSPVQVAHKVSELMAKHHNHGVSVVASLDDEPFENLTDLLEELEQDLIDTYEDRLDIVSEIREGIEAVKNELR